MLDLEAYTTVVLFSLYLLSQNKYANSMQILDLCTLTRNLY